HSPVVPVRLPCGSRRRRLSLGAGHLGVLTACWIRVELNNSHPEADSLQPLAACRCNDVTDCCNMGCVIFSRRERIRCTEKAPRSKGCKGSAMQRGVRLPASY